MVRLIFLFDSIGSMQSFKMTTEEFDHFLRNNKLDRQDNLKKIKSLYRSLEEKDDQSYDQALQRITKNLAFFRESKFAAVMHDFDARELIDSYQQKVSQLDAQISKMEKIIEKGCGQLIKREKSLHESKSISSLAEKPVEDSA